MTYRTLDGKPIKVTSDDVMSQADLSGAEGWQRPNWPGDLPWSRRIDRLYPNHLSVPWYFVHDGRLDGRAYVVGYDSEIGRRGSAMSDATVSRPANHFRKSSFRWTDARSMHGAAIQFLPYSSARGDDADAATGGERLCPFLLADDGLIAIDVNRYFVPDSQTESPRTARVVWKGANIASVATGYKERPAANRSPNQSSFLATIVLRTPDHVVILNSAGKEIAAYPIPTELRSVRFKLYNPRTKRFWIEAVGKQKLCWIDTTGKIVRQEHVELPQRSMSTRERIKETVNYSLCLPSPGSVAAMWVGKIWVVGRCQQWSDYWAALNEVLKGCGRSF